MAPTRPQHRSRTPYDITGNLCENNDKFAIDRSLPHIDMGDLLVIHDTGAHGYSMGYNYNGRLRSAEVLLRPDGSADLIRRAERPGDYFATLDVLPSGRELLAKSRAESARRRAQDERLAVAARVEQTHPDRGSEGEEHGYPQPRGFDRRPRHAV